jgi:hypothetical protein
MDGMNDRFQHVWSIFSCPSQWLRGIKGKIFALSKRESLIFFVCYRLSCFLSTTGNHEVGKTGELCQAIIFDNVLDCAVKKKWILQVFFTFQALLTENILFIKRGALFNDQEGQNWWWPGNLLYYLIKIKGIHGFSLIRTTLIARCQRSKFALTQIRHEVHTYTRQSLNDLKNRETQRPLIKWNHWTGSVIPRQRQWSIHQRQRRLHQRQRRLHQRQR